MRISDWSSDVCSSDLSYEAGLKFNLLDRRLTGSIAAYYVDWTNQQVSNTLFVASVSRTVTAIANAAKSRVKGIEFEGSAVLTDGFILNVGYSLNDARSEEHTSELQSLMRTSYAVFCLKKTHIKNEP